MMLDKKTRKKVPAAKRLIHLLDPVGKAFYKQVWKHRETKKWHFASGIMNTKEGENKQFCKCGRFCIAQKKEGTSVICNSYDVANAFCPSMAHEERGKVVEGKCGEYENNSQHVLKKRYGDACMYAQTETGSALVGALGTGGMQGDSVMPDQFTAGYNEGIQRRAEETARARG